MITKVSMMKQRCWYMTLCAYVDRMGATLEDYLKMYKMKNALLLNMIRVLVQFSFCPASRSTQFWCQQRWKQGHHHHSMISSSNPWITWQRSTLKQGKYNEIELLYQRSLATKKKSLEPYHHENSSILEQSINALQKKQGKRDEVELLFQKARWQLG